MIHVRHVTLPAGLSVLALREGNGDLAVFVSDALPPDRQRSAVRVALHASRRAGWRAGWQGTLWPVPAIALLAASRTWLRWMTSTLRAHAVASATATILVAASATALVTLQHDLSPASRLHAASGVRAPAAKGHRSHPAPRPVTSSRQVPALIAPPAQPTSTAAPPAKGKSTAPGRSTTPRPGTPSPSAPVASPTPSPTPSTTPAPTPTPTGSPGQGSGGCVRILGIKVCL